MGVLWECNKMRPHHVRLRSILPEPRVVNVYLQFESPSFVFACGVNANSWYRRACDLTTSLGRITWLDAWTSASL